MMISRDIERSKGENRASEDDELQWMKLPMNLQVEERGNIPHAHKVLHHELMKGLRRMSHIDLSRSVSKIGLGIRAKL